MENGEEQPGSLNIGQSLAERKMMEMIEPTVLKIFPQALKQPMAISVLQQVIRPILEGSLRKVVQEEIYKFEEKLLARGTRNDLPKERGLQLKFLDEAPDTVQTGKELRGKNGEFLKLALYDASEHTVTSCGESSARVDIVLLEASGNDDENDITPENFERRIIKDGDKEKPHFAKSVRIDLEKGLGILKGLKLGHGKDWTKSCNCRLGAIMLNSVVQGAWSSPFKVIDKRCKHYEKHDHPSSSSEVWRLKGIGRDGEPFRRLTEKNIKTVLDFRFWYSVNRKGLQTEILEARDSRWDTIVAHALKCNIDDKRMFSHKSPTEPQMCVVYDAVGELKGVIDKSLFVPIDNLSADRKNHAAELLSSVLELSAFGKRYKTTFDYEDSLVQEFPLQHCSNGSGPVLSENISGYRTRERGSSSHSTIDPNNSCDSLLGELSNSASGLLPHPKITGGGTPTDLSFLDYETPSLFDALCPGNHCYPTSVLSEEDEAQADAEQLLASACTNSGNVKPNDDMNHHQQHLTGLTVDGMFGELCSRPSNTSCYNLHDEDPWLCLSPNPMMNDIGDYLSYSTQPYDGHPNQSSPCGGEGSATRTRYKRKFKNMKEAFD